MNNRAIIFLFCIGLLAGGTVGVAYDLLLEERKPLRRSNRESARPETLVERPPTDLLRPCGMRAIPLPSLIDTRPKIEEGTASCGSSGEPLPEKAASPTEWRSGHEGMQGGFAPKSTDWEDIEPTSGVYMIKALGRDGVGIAKEVQPALFEHLKSTLPECFEGIDIPESIEDPYFKVVFLLNIESSEGLLTIEDISILDITFSDEELERCLLRHFEGRRRIEITSEITPGLRIRVDFPMVFQIASFASDNP